MKLRIRSLESKETHKIEVPNTCNLHQLKETINLQLFPSSSSSSSNENPNLFLSLNKKDELFGDSLEDSIQSLGITSGDLVYYSTNVYAFSSQNPKFGNPQNVVISATNDHDVNLMSTQMLECAKLVEIDVSSDQSPNLLSTQKDDSLEINTRNDQGVNFANTSMVESGKLDEIDVSSDAQVNELRKLSNLDDNNCDLMNAEGSNSGVSDEVTGSSVKNLDLSDKQMDGASKLSNPGDHNGDLGNVMESENLDEMEVDDESVSNVNTRVSVPGFLKNVYVKEVGDAADNGGNHKLLVIAVHAVLLESGFVSYDPVSGMKVDGFHLPDEWPSSAFGISLHYTLPVISSSEVVETAVLKFQSLGKFVNVFGQCVSLSKKGGEVHRVSLDEPKFLPALSYVWRKSDYTDLEKDSDGSMKLYPNREIFEFWKIVKDGLSYPLLIELCEQVGLTPPPCFMLLPTELKLQILETLPAVDIAKVACVSSELNFIASNNDLWKLKYEQEFGNAAASSQRESQWKAKFGSSWVFSRKPRKRVRVPWRWREVREPPHFRSPFGGRNPNPLGMPFVIGGDYDRLPVYGPTQHPGRRVFKTNCNLGGFGI